MTPHVYFLEIEYEMLCQHVDGYCKPEGYQEVSKPFESFKPFSMRLILFVHSMLDQPLH